MHMIKYKEVLKTVLGYKIFTFKRLFATTKILADG